jgi:hypothetical protein
MKMKWFAGALVVASLSAPAFAQVSVYLGATPPPLRYERRPPPPGEGFVWVNGYWGNDGRRYVWVPGRWNRPPYAGAYYVHPHYDRYPNGWRMHEGYWSHEEHDDHHDWDHHDRR